MNSESNHTAETTSVRRLLRHLTPLFLKHKYRLLLGFTTLLCVDLLQLSIPRVLKRGVDALAEGIATPLLLLRYGAIIIAIASMVVILRFCWRYAIIGFARYLERALRNKIYSHTVTMDMAFFEKRTTGDIMAHSSNDLGAIQMACGMGMVAAVDASMMTLAGIIFMATLHWKLTLLALIPMPFLAFCTRILTARIHTRFTRVQEEFSLLTEFSRAAMISIRLIKAYTMENLHTAKFDILGNSYKQSNIAVARIHGLLFPLSALIGNLSLLLLLFFGGRLAILGEITMGEFVAFITYLAMLTWPMMAIGWVTNLMQRGITSLTRIDNLLSEKPLLKDRPDSGFSPEMPTFSFLSLTFSYPGSSRLALNGIDSCFEEGFHGIAGRTGSGKSTLCKIMARLYPVADKSFTFSGRCVNTLSLPEVRNHIAYVAQEPVLFSDTIEANITLGKEGATTAVIQQAAQLAAIHQDILEFPKGYQTRIGERGVKLSGGQRQRLALARALLVDRPVLIIDDGLSAVDVETEHEIFSSLRHHLQGKIVIFVSNRLKLLSMTDRILIMENGRITDSGNHEALLARNDFYQAMYDKQIHPSSGEVLS